MGLQTRTGIYYLIRSSSSVSFALPRNSWFADLCRGYNNRPANANVPQTTMTLNLRMRTTIRWRDQIGDPEEPSSSRCGMSHLILNGPRAAATSSGYVLIIISLRDVPKLAKNPPPPRSFTDLPNPCYILFRSFVFNRKDWRGYEHRMTKGERAHGQGKTGEGGEDRTWEFYLKDE